MHWTVTIGTTNLSEYVKDVQIKSIAEPHSHRSEATVVLDLRCLRDFYHTNLRDGIVIEDKSRRRREFTGVVVESYSIDSQMHVLSCRSAEEYLRELVVPNTVHFENFTPQEIAYHIVKQTSDVDASEESIQGLSLNRQERDFLVAVPVHGLVIKDPVAMPPVTFSRLEENSHDSKIMLEKAEWNEGTAIARTTVKSSSFLAACTIGRETISRAVDALSYGAKLSSLGYPKNGDYKTHDWERTATFSKLSLGEQTYLRDMSTDPPKTWLRSEPTREADLELVGGNSLMLTSDTALKRSNSLGSLAVALRWLRLGTQENDLTDRLLDYWVALEFLVANEKVPTLLSKKALDDLESTIMAATIRKGDDEIMTTEEKLRLSVRARSRINQIDLRERFDAFRENRKNAITITSDEYERVWGKDGLRDQRNALEHGRSVDVDEDALKTMKHVLDKMILAILSAGTKEF